MTGRRSGQVVTTATGCTRMTRKRKQQKEDDDKYEDDDEHGKQQAEGDDNNEEEEDNDDDILDNNPMCSLPNCTHDDEDYMDKAASSKPTDIPPSRESLLKRSKAKTKTT